MSLLDDNTDNHVTIFQLDGQPVRGRIIRLGDALNQAIGTRYPEIVAGILGEAMTLAAIVALSLKFKGRLLIQCHGTNEGAISLLLADCTTDGAIRGYARWDEESLKDIKLDNRNPGAQTLLGGGTFSMTIDQGAKMDQYQGLAAIEGERLSECAEHYFAQSEQVPTHIRLACGQVQTPGQSMSWRGGGIMIQKIADDELRGGTKNAWVTAKSLFGTVSDEELIDPNLESNTLLYRLFHEDGVRAIQTTSVEAKCTCSRTRLKNTLKSFDAKALEDMAENGEIKANCEFCDTDYVFELAAL